MIEQKQAPEVETSEYGSGLCYCLGLFLAHAGDLDRRRQHYRSVGHFDSEAFERWMAGGYDHLSELQIEAAPPGIRGRVEEFVNKCLEFVEPLDLDKLLTLDEAEWTIREAKELLRLIDESHGVATKRSDHK